MMRVVVVLFLFFHGLFFSQAYQPSDSVNLSYKDPLISKFEKEKQQFLDIARTKDSKQRKLYTEIYKGVFDNMLGDIKNNEIYYYPQLEGLIKDIITEFSQYHPEIQTSDYKILISRNSQKNAYMTLNGTLVFNQNFLRTLDNENQLAAVIAHEIGHNLLKHTAKAIDDKVKAYTNDSIVAISKNLKKQEFNRNKEAEKLLKNIVFESKKTTREHEKLADAKSFEIIRTTKYSTKEIIGLLKNLDVADIETDTLLEEDYEKLLFFSDLGFDKTMLKPEEESEYKSIDENYFKWNVDSLKTHPSCKERIALIETQKGNEQTEFNLKGNLFAQLKANAEKENINNAFLQKNYGESLYNSLKLIRKQPDDDFGKMMIVKNLQKLKEARIQKNYGKYIRLDTDQKQTQSQEMFFNFFEQLNNTNFDKILDFFSQKYGKYEK